jgi:maltooligosyltrehalose trehalohydrolase
MPRVIGGSVGYGREVQSSYGLLTEGFLGAEPLPGGGVRFRVWAPFVERVQVEVDGIRHELEPEEHGYHAGAVEEAGVGSRYGFVLDPDAGALPDPASRAQPEGVHELSEVVAPPDPPPPWSAPDLRDLVIAELHVGTASPDGTFDGLLGYVEHLADVGVNAVELMPVTQFPGTRNWGYDGVFPYAVHDSYGGPAGLRRFVEACHELGVAVFLDVVYNHVGPEGNVLGRFGPYFTHQYRTPWGDAINFDGPDSDEVRRYFGGNALMWLEEFGIDGLRLDAIHGILDTTARPFLLELAEAVGDLRERLGSPRYVIAESDLGDVRFVRSGPRDGGAGFGFDGLWNDDFHHAVHVLVTGERAGYYADFGRIEQIADAIAHGFVHRGQHSAFRRRRHGSDSTGLPPERFVVFAQNHDQIGNRIVGDRLHTAIGFELQKVVLGVTLLAPNIPLLFQGEEYGETAPFPYFVSHTDPDLVEAVRRGRATDFASFEWAGDPPDPQAESTFESARIRPESASEPPHAHVLAFTRELIRLRREVPSLRGGVPAEAEADPESCVLTVWREEGHSQSLLLANFGESDQAPPGPDGEGWTLALHSADDRWGGPGAAGRLPSQSLALWVRRSG